MSRVSKSTNSETLNRTFGDYLCGRLQSHDETASLVSSWKAEQDCLVHAAAESRKAYSEYQFTRGPEQWVEMEIHREIRKFSKFAVFHLNGRDHHRL